MAHVNRLRSGPARAGMVRRLALALLLVVLAHGLLLEWLSRQQVVSLLQPLATPLFTRVLQPQDPPPAPVLEQKVTPVRGPRSRSAINSIATDASVPQSTATLALPGPATEAPPAPAVEVPLAAASAPDAGAAPRESALAPGAEPSAPATTVTSAVAATTVDTATATGPVDNWPSDTRLSYRLSGKFRSGGLYGDARVQWQREGSRYQARIDINLDLFGGRVLTSQGEVTPQGLMPSIYEELRSGKTRGAKLGDSVVTLADGRSVARPAGVQDTASQFVELSHRFATGRDPLEVGRSVSLWIARPGAVDLWTYDIVEREMLKTPHLGEIEAFRLKPRPIANPRGNITAEMWFAPSLQYLPVRIRVSLGEEAFVDLLVDRIEQR